jgi:calcineurin-like phosphoesterase
VRELRLAGLVIGVLLVLVLVGSLVTGLGGGSDASTAEEPVPDVAGERVRVEVLNAAGVPGLARDATERLREAGFDVVLYGNATGFGPDTSWVLDRVGRPEAAERVAEALGIGQVRTAIDSTLYLDVSVILGRDWAKAPADSAR